MKATVFSENLADLPTKLHAVILRKVSNLNIHRSKYLRSHVILTQKKMLVMVMKHLLISMRQKLKGQVHDAQIIFTPHVVLHF
jgi:hypothetical protein